MISRIIQTQVSVICRNEAEADNIDRDLNNSCYYISIVKVAFFMCFIGREHIT